MEHMNLNYRYRKQRLNFTDNLVCDENELSVVDLPAEKMEELLAEGRISELQELIDASWRDQNKQCAEVL